MTYMVRSLAEKENDHGGEENAAGGFHRPHRPSSVKNIPIPPKEKKQGVINAMDESSKHLFN